MTLVTPASVAVMQDQILPAPRLETPVTPFAELLDRLDSLSSSSGATGPAQTEALPGARPSPAAPGSSGETPSHGETTGLPISSSEGGPGFTKGKAVAPSARKPDWPPKAYEWDPRPNEPPEYVPRGGAARVVADHGGEFDDRPVAALGFAEPGFFGLTRATPSFDAARAAAPGAAKASGQGGEISDLRQRAISAPGHEDVRGAGMARKETGASQVVATTGPIAPRPSLPAFGALPPAGGTPGAGVRAGERSLEGVRGAVAGPKAFPLPQHSHGPRLTVTEVKGQLILVAAGEAPGLNPLRVRKALEEVSADFGFSLASLTFDGQVVEASNLHPGGLNASRTR